MFYVFMITSQESPTHINNTQDNYITSYKEFFSILENDIIVLIV